MGEKLEDRELNALCKLFIGGLPRTITDEDLEIYFLKFTPDESLNDCIVIKDKEDKQSRGFGFVTYNRLADADNCLASGPHNIGGKDVEVKHAIPRDEKLPANHIRTNKIFAGGLTKETTEEDISEALQNHVLECGESLNAEVTKVEIIKTKKEDGVDPPVSRGFAFLDMATNADADKVVIVKHFKINGKQVELKKAAPKGGAGSGRGGGRGGGGRGSGQFGGVSGGWGAGAYNGGLYDAVGFGFSGGYGYGAGYGGYSGGRGGYSGGYGDSSGMFGQYSQQSSGFGPSRGGRTRGHGNAPY